MYYEREPQRSDMGREATSPDAAALELFPPLPSDPYMDDSDDEDDVGFALPPARQSIPIPASPPASETMDPILKILRQNSCPLLPRIIHRLLKQEIYMTTRFVYVSRPFDFRYIPNAEQAATATVHAILPFPTSRVPRQEAVQILPCMWTNLNRRGERQTVLWWTLMSQRKSYRPLQHNPLPTRWNARIKS
jgi:hypothetical protein